MKYLKKQIPRIFSFLLFFILGGVCFASPTTSTESNLNSSNAFEYSGANLLTFESLIDHFNFAPPITGTTTFVKPTSTGNGSGADWDNAVGAVDLKTSIESGGNIFIAAGSYSIASSILITNNVCVQGGFPLTSTGTDTTTYNPILNPTIIEGQGTARLIDNTVTVDTLELKGLVLQNGVAPAGGGSAFKADHSSSIPIVYSFIDLKVINNLSSSKSTFYIEHKTNSNAKILFSNCLFDNNNSNSAGVIFLSLINTNSNTNDPNPENLVIEDCTFTNNTAYGAAAIRFQDTDQWTIRGSSFCNNETTITDGAAISTWQCDVLDIIDCDFSSNSSIDEGGALYMGRTSVTISGSTFSENTAADNEQGGAIYGYDNSTLELTNSNFYNNQSATGAALYWNSPNSNGPLFVVDSCIFESNTSITTNGGATYGGGAIKSFRTNLNISNSFFVGNTVTATGFGGAINIYEATVELTNNLFFDNLVGTSNNTFGADIVNYSSLSKFSPMSGNKMQLSAASDYLNVNGSATNPNSYDFTNDTFLNTDNGSLPPPPNIVCPADIAWPADDCSQVFNQATCCDSPLAEYAITNGAISKAGQTTNYFWDNASTPPQDVMLTQQHGTIRATEFCQKGNWDYYLNPNDPDMYIFAIEQGANVTPIEYIEIRTEDNPSDRYVVNGADATFVMARDWFVKTVNDDPLLDAGGNAAPVNVRFYFAEEEFKEILDEAIIMANSWGGNVPTVADVYWFKRDVFDPLTHIDATGSMLTPRITTKRMAATTALGVNTADDVPGTAGNGKNHIQFNGITGFSGGTAAISINRFALPVELTSFDVQANGCDAMLSWSTETETNFSHYIIERSKDGIDFEYVEKVLALPFEGMKAYSYTDENVRGKVFYRLKMIDLDGTYEFSKIEVVTTDCESQISNLNLYPNPVGLQETNINISFMNKSESVVWITISDILGSELMKFPIDSQLGENTVNLDISNFEVGTYYITIQKSKGKPLTKKFVKISE